MPASDPGDRLQRRLQTLAKVGSDRSDEDLLNLDELLARARAVAALPSKARMELCRAMTLRRVAAGAVVVTAGERSPEMFIVLSGTLDVALPGMTHQTPTAGGGSAGPDSPGGAEPLSLLHAGDCFGEEGALAADEDTQPPGLATVTAVSPCVLAVVPLDSAQPLMATAAAAHASLPQKVAYLRSVPLFRDLAEPLLQAIAYAAEVRDLPPGTVLCRQGCECDELYLVAFGLCRAVREVRGASLTSLMRDAETRPATAAMSPPPAPPNPYTPYATTSRGDGGGRAGRGARRSLVTAPAALTGLPLSRSPSGPGPRTPGADGRDAPPRGSSLLTVSTSRGAGGPSLSRTASARLMPDSAVAAAVAVSRTPSLTPGLKTGSGVYALAAGATPGSSGRPVPPPALDVGGGGGGGRGTPGPRLGSMAAEVAASVAAREATARGAAAAASAVGGRYGGGAGILFDVGCVERRGWFGDLTPSGGHKRMSSTVYTATEARLFVLNKIDVLRRLDRRTIARVAAMAEMAATDSFPEDAAVCAEYVQSRQWERYKRALVLDIVRKKKT